MDSVLCHLLRYVPGDAGHLIISSIFNRLSPCLNRFSHLPFALQIQLQSLLSPVSGPCLQRVAYPRPFLNCYLSLYDFALVLYPVPNFFVTNFFLANVHEHLYLEDLSEKFVNKAVIYSLFNRAYETFQVSA